MRLVHCGLLLVLAMLLFLTGCGTTGDNAGESEPSEFVFQVTSGGTSTTASPERVTELPFSREVIIDLIFEEPVISATGRSSIRVSTSPTFWRVMPLTSGDADTYSFTITNSSPGAVVVTVQIDSESEPIAFTLQIGEAE